MGKAGIFLIMIWCISCYNEEFENPPELPGEVITDALFSINIPLGEVQNDELKEVSGIASSKNSNTILWAHNDRGDEARIFMLDENGNNLGTFHLNGLKARDWEDMVTGPGPERGKSYLYIADIGDNHSKYSVLHIYRFEEPGIQSNIPIDETIFEFDVIDLVFPDKARDAETLLIDPLTKDLFVITKKDEFSEIYVARYPQSLDEVNHLEFVGRLPFRLAVGGDISKNGREIVIKNYDHIYYWIKSGNETISELLLKDPLCLPYEREPQGEAIAWKRDGSGFYTLSEEKNDVNAVIYFYRRF